MWTVRLDEKQVAALKLLIEAQGEVGPELSTVVDALELARWDPLPEAELPWEEVTDRALRQGVGEADIFWDLAGRTREEAALPIVKRTGSRRTRRRGVKA